MEVDAEADLTRQTGRPAATARGLPHGRRESKRASNLGEGDGEDEDEDEDEGAIFGCACVARRL